MSDLISREALINEFKNPDLFNVTEKHLSIIGNAPAVNAVEVVFCKNCIYQKDAKVNCKGFIICPASNMEITDDDYCSYGERRESEASK